MRSVDHAVAVVARRVPTPLVRWIGARQYDSRFWRRVGTLARRAMSQDGVIPHGHAAGIRFNGGGGNAGYALGTSEVQVQDTLAGMIEPGCTVYDIGANAGFYTVMAARLTGPAGHVVAFEPLPANVALIRHNVAINTFENVRVEELAVGRGPAHASFTLGRDTTRGGLTTQHVEPGVSGTIDVEVNSIDSLVEAGAIPPPDVIKMDVEGAEVEALIGAERTLKGHRPALLVELHGTSQDIDRFLTNAGYDAKLLESSGPISGAPWGSYVLALPGRS